MLDLSGPSAQAFLVQVERAAQSLGLQHTLYDVRQLDQLPAVLAGVQADGLVVVSGGAMGGGNDPRIGRQSSRPGTPAVAELRSFAVAGGLLSHGANTAVLARRSAGLSIGS